MLVSRIIASASITSAERPMKSTLLSTATFALVILSTSALATVLARHDGERILTGKEQ
jgi:hypothetical protein